MSRKKSFIIFLIFSIYLASGLRAVSEGMEPDTGQPASISGIQVTTGKFFINNSWINPADTNYSHAWFKYSNDNTLQNVSRPTDYLNLTWSPHYTQNISAQTVDISGNVNQTKVWFNATIPNSPIIITNTSNWAGAEGRTVYLDFDYIDDDLDTGIFLTNAEKGTLDSSTGIFIWQNALAGIYHWEFNVSDGYGSISSFPAIISVNESLSMISYAPTDAAVTDHAGATRVFEAAFNQAADVNWYMNGYLIKTDSGTASSSYTNTSAKEGIRDVEVSASNTNGSISRMWTWVVNDYTPGAPADIRGDTYNFGVNWTWTKGIYSDFTVVWVNGTLRGNSQENFYNFTEGVPHGTYDIQLREYNSTQGAYGGWANQTTTIPDNPVQIINISDYYSLAEGKTLVIDADYTDMDGDTGLFVRNFTIGAFNENTGVLTWTTAEGDQGTYLWEINVTDGYGSATKAFKVSVGDSTPVSPAALSNTTGNFWINWTWDAGNNSDDYDMLVDGVDTGADTADMFYNGTYQAHAQRTISIRAHNHTLDSYSNWINQTTSIPNNPPVQAQIGNREIYKGQELTFSISTADADSDTVTYGTNATKGYLNTATGIYTWIPGDGDAGKYIWEFNSSDGYGGTASETIAVTVKNPLDIDLRFIEPYIINDSGIWNEAWRNASTGHLNKYIGIDHIFRNTGNTSLIITNITRIYNNASREPEELYRPQENEPPMMLTLAENESKSCPDFENKPITICRNEFEIDPAEISNGVFNFTMRISVMGYSGADSVFKYTNSTNISLPMVPISGIKRADDDVIPVEEGRTTTVTYTLEANSSVNLTDVRITDDLYTSISGNESYFIKDLEANRSQQISYRYPVTTDVLSRYRCEGGIPCVINLANFTAYDPVNNVFYNDTDYVEICVNCVPVTGGDTVRSSSPGGGSSGGGGGGIPPSEDFKNIERREVREMDILAKQANVYVFRSVEPVMVVTFESSVSEYDVPVAVEVLRNRSKNIKADAPGKPYKYFNVFVGSSGFSKKVSNGVVVVQVNNSWLEENSFDPEGVSLYKWQGEWVKKETEIVEKKSNYTYYASFAGNFSSFAIAWDKEHVDAYVSGIPAYRSEPAKNATDSLASLPDTVAPQKRDTLPAAFIFLFGLVGIIIYLRRNHSK